jgi:hypothetical protein
MTFETDKDAFGDDFLKFSLQKPSHWQFIPSAWSPVALLQRSEEPGLAWAKHANLPFCCAMGHHDSPRHAYPTMQVTVRPFQVPGNQGAADLLEQNLAFLCAHQVDFALLDATTELIIAGCRANRILSRYALITQKQGEEQCEFSVLSRSYAIFAPGRAFTLGLSSSADENYFDEADFAGIVESVRIGG